MLNKKQNNINEKDIYGNLQFSNNLLQQNYKAGLTQNSDKIDFKNLINSQNGKIKSNTENTKILNFHN
mgnify:CR=1 FL=1